MDDPKQRKHRVLSSLKVRPLERNLALTKLGLGAGTKIAAHSLANIFRGKIERSAANRAFYERQAQILADELGRLKGSAMKAGQMLSLYGQYFLPEEAVAVLSELQDDTPAVPWKQVAPALEKALGRSRLRELEIDTHPLAAASLGQVHRARRISDGSELCVKIQYPGVAAAVDSDVSTISRLMAMTRLVPSGLNLAPVFDELREMLALEIDYASEARFTEYYARELAGDARYVVPQVFREYSTDTVLTTGFETGVSIRHKDVQALSQRRRDRLGRALFDLFLTEFFGWGMVQTDPHFGNYRVRSGPQGRDQLVLLDFGATRRYRRPFVRAYGEIVAGAVARDRERIFRGSRRIGLAVEGLPDEAFEAFALMCETIVEPFRGPEDGAVPKRLLTAQGHYRFGASDLPMRVAQTAARNALSVHFRVPPREIVFLHRRLSGVFVGLAALDAELSLREPLLEALEQLHAAP